MHDILNQWFSKCGFCINLTWWIDKNANDQASPQIQKLGRGSSEIYILSSHSGVFLMNDKIWKHQFRLQIWLANVALKALIKSNFAFFLALNNFICFYKSAVTIWKVVFLELQLLIWYKFDFNLLKIMH